MNKRIITFLVIVLCIIICLITFKTEILKAIYPKEYEEIVSNYAQQYAIEESLVFAVIKAESNFNEKAISNKNAIGLMQIMEGTAKEVANQYDIPLEEVNIKEEILKVENNINIGTKYLSILMEKYGNLELAVSAYNAGTGTVDKWIEEGILTPERN